MERIPSHCVNECYDVKVVEIPRTVTSVEGTSFFSCSDLVSIEVNETNPSFISIDGVLMSRDMKKIIKCPDSKTSFEVPEGVEIVGYDAFKHCKNISELVFPSSTHKVENGGLDMLWGRTISIVFGGSLTFFGNQQYVDGLVIKVKSDDDKQLILQGQTESRIKESNIIVEE